MVFSSASRFQKFAVSLMERTMSHQVLSWVVFFKHYYGYVREMQDRGISFTERISKATFASKVSCLAKEWCIPSIPHFEIPLATVI
jgi:hypothetical protein